MNGKYQVGSGRIVTFTHDTPFIDNSIPDSGEKSNSFSENSSENSEKSKKSLSDMSIDNEGDNGYNGREECEICQATRWFTIKRK